MTGWIDDGPDGLDLIWVDHHLVYNNMYIVYIDNPEYMFSGQIGYF